MVFYVVMANEPVMSKFLFTFITSFILIMCIYHLLIRPYNGYAVLVWDETEEKEQRLSLKLMLWNKFG